MQATTSLQRSQSVSSDKPSTSLFAYIYQQLHSKRAKCLLALYSCFSHLTMSSVLCMLMFLCAVGGILGFALVWGGSGAVKWAVKNDRNFPPYDGVLPIILSWFVAPILTASASAGIFAICRQFVLRRSNGVARSYYVLPLAVFITTWVNIYFVLTKVRAECACESCCCSRLTVL
jgi:phosphate/sulfate permease